MHRFCAREVELAETGTGSSSRSAATQQPGHCAGATRSHPDEAEVITTSAEELAMSITRESIPQTWNDERDVPFFTIVAHLFDADFVFGAGVLLAANSITDE